MLFPRFLEDHFLLLKEIVFRSLSRSTALRTPLLPQFPLLVPTRKEPYYDGFDASPGIAGVIGSRSSSSLSLCLSQAKRTFMGENEEKPSKAWDI
jgi:hypothetical protein